MKLTFIRTIVVVICFLAGPAIADVSVLQTVERYTQALIAGDVEELKTLLGSSLYTKRRMLLEENTEYPEFLRQYYDNAAFSSTLRDDSRENRLTSAMVDVVILMGNGSTITTTLSLSLQESFSGALDWKIVDQFWPIVVSPNFTGIEPLIGPYLSASTEIFRWRADGVSVDTWWLYVGTSVGGNELYNSGSLNSNVLSAEVSGLPTDGSTLWVRLWFRADSWQSIDYQFTAAIGDVSNNELEVVAGVGLSGSAEQSTVVADEILSITDRYTQALTAGDVNVLKAILGGRLYRTRRVLLEQNTEYPSKLREYYTGANFASALSTRVSERYENSRLVDVEILFGNGDSTTTTLILQESTVGASDWKIVDYVR